VVNTRRGFIVAVMALPFVRALSVFAIGEPLRRARIEITQPGDTNKNYRLGEYGAPDVNYTPSQIYAIAVEEHSHGWRSWSDDQVGRLRTHVTAEDMAWVKTICGACKGGL
jgi:hypothetical protein